MPATVPPVGPVIIVVDNSRAVTGALNAMRHATGPMRTQFQFVYILPTGSTARVVLEEDGYLVHELPFVEISRRKKDLLLYLPLLVINGWRLARLARQHSAQLIHLNDFYNLVGYAARLLSLGRIRVVTHVRFLPQTQVQLLARSWRWLAEAFAERVLCVSQAVRRYFGPLAHVQVVYDPLPDTEAYAVPTVPAMRPDNTIQLLYLSNFIAGKGQDLALVAFIKAYTQYPDLRLHFAGGDMGMEKNRAFRQQLEAQVAAAGLGTIVTFGGFVADVEAAMKRADIILNFSESESFSLTCLDALFYGIPLIASDCGGPAELFESGKSGLLVPNRDVSAMANGIITLAANAQLRTQFAAQGRSFVRQKFTPSHTYQLLGQVYQQLLAENA